MHEGEYLAVGRLHTDIGHWTFDVYLGVGLGDGCGRGPSPNSSGFGKIELEL